MVGGGTEKPAGSGRRRGGADVAPNETLHARPRLFLGRRGRPVGVLTAGAIDRGPGGGEPPGTAPPGWTGLPEALDTDRVGRRDQPGPPPGGGGGLLSVRGSGMLQEPPAPLRGLGLRRDRQWKRPLARWRCPAPQVAIRGSSVGGVPRDVVPLGFVLRDLRLHTPSRCRGSSCQAEIGLPDLRALGQCPLGCPQDEYGSHVSPGCRWLLPPGSWTARASVGADSSSHPFVEQNRAAGLPGLSGIERALGGGEGSGRGPLDLGRTLADWS